MNPEILLMIVGDRLPHRDGELLGSEITNWKFRTRLIVAAVICSDFVPFMLWVVRMTAHVVRSTGERLTGG
jgi:hypothetical protein